MWSAWCRVEVELALRGGGGLGGVWAPSRGECGGDSAPGERRGGARGVDSAAASWSGLLGRRVGMSSGSCISAVVWPAEGGRGGGAEAHQLGERTRTTRSDAPSRGCRDCLCWCDEYGRRLAEQQRALARARRDEGGPGGDSDRRRRPPQPRGTPSSRCQPLFAARLAPEGAARPLSQAEVQAELAPALLALSSSSSLSPSQDAAAPLDCTLAALVERDPPHRRARPQLARQPCARAVLL